MKDVLRDSKDVRIVMESLSVDGLNQYEVEQIFADGVKCMQDSWEAKNQNTRRTNSYVDQRNPFVPIAYIIAGSEIFRHSLLNLKTSSAFCALVKTRLGELLTQKQLSKIAKNALEFQSSRTGTVIYETVDTKDRWFVLLSGKLRACLHESDLDKSLKNGCVEETGFSSDPLGLYHDILEGEIFGGFGIEDQSLEQSQLPHISIKVMSTSEVLELRPEDLKCLLNEDPQTAAKVISLLQGKNFDFFRPLSYTLLISRCRYYSKIVEEQVSISAK